MVARYKLLRPGAKAPQPECHMGEADYTFPFIDAGPAFFVVLALVAVVAVGAFLWKSKSGDKQDDAGSDSNFGA
jgi:uncharacterized protein (DUF983 family)